MANQEDVVYRLNHRDEIVFVNEAWDRFALANGAPEMAAGHVLGRGLWEFIADPTTQQIYRDLCVRVREGRLARFPFRCDSPQQRRFLEMNIYRLEDGQVEFHTRTLAIEHRPAVPLLDRRSDASGDPLRMCSWCKKVFADGEWVEIEEGIARLRLFERSTFPPPPAHPRDVRTVLSEDIREPRGDVSGNIGVALNIRRDQSEGKGLHRFTV